MAELQPGPPLRAAGVSGLWRRFRGMFSRRDLMEGLLVGLAFLLYFAVRGAVVDRPETAYRHALDVIDAQRSLGIFWEDDMNDWIKDRQFLAQTANIVYFWLHFPLIIAFGIYLYYGQRSKYTLMRDAFLLSGAIALVIYWLYPVAPPRALPELARLYDNGGPVYVRGFFDTMQEYLGYGYQAQSTQAFVNPYAAMPSLHFGWDLLLGIGIVWASWRQRLMWLTLPIGVFLPLSQIPAITATANHFFLDAAAGALVALCGFPAAWGLRHWVYPRLIASLERSPWPCGCGAGSPLTPASRRGWSPAPVWTPGRSRAPALVPVVVRGQGAQASVDLHRQLADVGQPALPVLPRHLRLRARHRFRHRVVASELVEGGPVGAAACPVATVGPHDAGYLHHVGQVRLPVPALELLHHRRVEAGADDKVGLAAEH